MALEVTDHDFKNYKFKKKTLFWILTFEKNNSKVKGKYLKMRFYIEDFNLKFSTDIIYKNLI